MTRGVQTTKQIVKSFKEVTLEYSDNFREVGLNRFQNHIETIKDSEQFMVLKNMKGVTVMCYAEFFIIILSSFSLG